MIDLHTHLLPGVDDGAADWGESTRMAELAASTGCSTIVATPHLRHPSFPDVRRSALEPLFPRLAEHLSGIVEVHPGAEVRIDSDLLDDVERWPDSEVIPLAGSRYLLLELDWQGVGPEPRELIHEVKLMGWRPIIAHPELMPQLAGDLDLTAELADLGATFQLTAASLTGNYGLRARRRAWEMLEAGLAHFIASDAHGISWRPPGLDEAVTAVTERLGEEVARRLTVDNPSRVLENRELDS